MDLDKVVRLLTEMNAQQEKTDELGDREVAWYYWRGKVAEALGLPTDYFVTEESP